MSGNLAFAISCSFQIRAEIVIVSVLIYKSCVGRNSVHVITNLSVRILYYSFLHCGRINHYTVLIEGI